MQNSTRGFSNRRFRMVKNSANSDGDVFKRPIEELLGPELLGRATDMREETRNNDSYESEQLLYAGYAMLESPIVGPLSISGGVRTEVLTQKVESHSPFPAGGGEIKRTERTDIDYLPGAALKYQLSPKLVLRAAYGMTVARPQIRELAPYQYYDFLRDRGVEGNPDLKRTRIHNLDLRGEWFFAEGQIVALSGFYKRFLDPIELTIIDNIGGGAQYNNGTSAQNLGAEVETRVNLGRLANALRVFDFDAKSRVPRRHRPPPARSARPPPPGGGGRRPQPACRCRAAGRPPSAPPRARAAAPRPGGSWAARQGAGSWLSSGVPSNSSDTVMSASSSPVHRTCSSPSALICSNATAPSR